MACFQTDDATGDRVRVGGRFVRISGAEEILQQLRTRWRLIRGEVLLDQTAGPRYIGVLLEAATPPSRVESELAAEGLQVPGVVDFDTLTATIDNATRVCTVDVVAVGSLADQRERIPLADRITIKVGE